MTTTTPATAPIDAVSTPLPPDAVDFPADGPRLERPQRRKLIGLARWFCNTSVWGYGLFWSWNVVFLAFMLLGFAPVVLPSLVLAVRVGTIPPAFLAFGLVLIAIPVGAVVLGSTILRRSPSRLFALGYGVEAPLMLGLALRFFVIREANAAVAWLLVVAGLGILTLLWQILDERAESRASVFAAARVVGLTLLLVTMLYAGVWLLFYAVPLGVGGLKGLVGVIVHLPDALRGGWQALGYFVMSLAVMVPFVLLGSILVAYSATLFVVMPVALATLSIRAWSRGMRAATTTRLGLPGALALAGASLVACVVPFVAANQQQQGEAFALLRTAPTSVAEARALLDKEETIHAGLLNAYLAPFRYLSTAGEVRHVSGMYQSVVGLSPEASRLVEDAYALVARPVLYLPAGGALNPTGRPRQALREEPEEAARLYAAYFDRSIIEGERVPIVSAVRSTYSLEQAEAAWQAVDDHDIHVETQEVTVVEHGDWAEVELHEVYRNQTARREEVVYYFSLPESAAITGLWLGTSADRATRFPYRVAPRGAAQAVYRNEIRRQVDPALVEQIGPRQYRLRAFPVEPKRPRGNSIFEASVEQGPPLHLWLTYRVLATDGGWPLPQLAEKRNVYWDQASRRLLNGTPLSPGLADWLPASVPARAPVAPRSHRVDLPGGVTVVARPAETADLPQLAAGMRLAVVIDRSRSMEPHRSDVKAALASLASLAEQKGSDAYLTASPFRGEEPSLVPLGKVDADSMLFFGGQNPAELLAQFGRLSAGRRYDAVVVLTDGTGYALGNGGVTVPGSEHPIWMVHLGRRLPLGYDDATLAAIQSSGGGIAGSVDEALIQWAIARGGSEGTPMDAATTALADRYLWSTVPTSALDATGDTSDDGFVALAARRAILAQTQRDRPVLDQVAALDRLHKIAIKAGVVTPYSSMIVLVESSQQKLLDQLEARGDRFEREVEEVGDTKAANPLTVNGVPEPEEWLLLAVALAMLVWYLRRHRLGPSPTRFG